MTYICAVIHLPNLLVEFGFMDVHQIVNSKALLFITVPWISLRPIFSVEHLNWRSLPAL